MENERDYKLARLAYIQYWRFMVETGSLLVPPQLWDDCPQTMRDVWWETVHSILINS